MRRRVAVAAPAVTVALALGACGGQSKSQAPSAAPAAHTLPAPSATPSTPAPAPGTGAYSGRVQAALTPVQLEFRAVQANPQTAKLGSTWTKIAAVIRAAQTRISALTPPTGAAAIQSKLASLLGAMADDSAKVGVDLSRKDSTAAKADLTAFRADALKLQSFGQQLQAR